MTNVHITGWGMSVPEQVMTNFDLEKLVKTSDEWIVEMTGIRERRIAREGQTTASLAVEAAWNALKVAKTKPNELDLIICATSTPEYIFPATACIVQDRLGATKAGAFDLSAACSGFIFAVNMATQAIKSGSIQRALVIGAETLSKIVNWEDRNTCILFGDGAGAVVLEGNDLPGGILSAVMHSDGAGAEFLTLPGGGSQNPVSEATIRAGLHTIKMDGREVFRFATRVMAGATHEALKASGKELDEVDWIIPHQANFRIIDAAARALKLPMEKFVVNLEKYGNTSTASIPMAMCEAANDGRIKKDDLIVLVGFGAGLTWGAMVANWTGTIDKEKPIRPGYLRLLARVRSKLRKVKYLVEGLLFGRGKV